MRARSGRRSPNQVPASDTGAAGSPIVVVKAWNVMHMRMDPRDGRLHAATVHEVFGPSTHYSDDLGETWVQAVKSPVFETVSETARPIGTPDEAREPEEAADKPEKVLKVWNITPGRTDEPDTLYAGIEPGALFKSTDRGETWEINDALYNHPHRPDWLGFQPGPNRCATCRNAP